MLAEKLALIDRVVRTTGAGQPGSPVTSEQRTWMLQALYAMPLSAIKAMGVPGGAEATMAAIARESSRVSKNSLTKFGQAGAELVYTPINPCRFIDTRNGIGKIGSPPYPINLDTTGATYGGSPACNPVAAVGGDSTDIAAIAMNVTIVDPSAAPGFMGARPIGSTNTTSLVNWYLAGSTIQAANAAIVTSDTTGLPNEIEFFGTTTHLVVDVLGVFAAPVSTPLDCRTGTLTNVALGAPGPYNLAATTCPAGFGMVSNSCGALGDVANVRQAGAGVVTASNAVCFGRYEGATSVTITNTPWCCRIPGRLVVP
jgi:hypothetical protein